MTMSAHALLRGATGLNLSQTVVERAVRQRMAQSAFRDSDDYLQALTPDELTQLIELVLVPESWLFRNPQAFEAATEFVQARMAGARPDAPRPVRILSIPCAGGEEPYSMAMALRDAGVPKDAFSIDAFDLSPVCIARARSGVYGRNAFRSQDHGFRERYFTHIGDDDYRIIDSVRAQVSFKQGNLLQFDSVACAKYYDVVFCRNLLIYFDQPTTRAAIAILAALLADDGMLLAGYAEVPSFCHNGFAILPHKQAFALQKDPGLARTKPAPAPRRTLAPVPAAQRSLAPAARPVAASAPPKAPSAPAALAENLLQQAHRLADLGQFQAAGEKCHAHLAQVPDAADAYFILGLLSEHARQTALAQHHWRRCLYLQPDHYEALCHLALLAEHDGDAAGAATLKARAARLFQRRQAP